MKKGTMPTQFIRRKIGNTTYLVAVSFSTTSRENMEDKITRLAENELRFDDFSAILKSPQTVTERNRCAPEGRIFARSLGENHEGLLLQGGSLS